MLAKINKFRAKLDEFYRFIGECTVCIIILFFGAGYGLAQITQFFIG